jgi:pyruvate carboxylase
VPITKILVANRSEIAIRVFRAANELGIKTVAIWAEEDKLLAAPLQGRRGLPGRPRAAWPPDMGPIESYLSIDEIIRVAKLSGADAIHPGYGLLSESPEFADACAEAGIIFIGPSPDTMRRLGNKVAARNLAIEAARRSCRQRIRCRTTGRDQKAGAQSRLSGDAEGLVGRRRARHAHHSRRG